MRHLRGILILTLCILHLKDGRRLYGWPREWPSRPERGHFRIIEAEWLIEGENDSTSEEIPEISAIVVSVEDVAMVEFIKVEQADEE